MENKAHALAAGLFTLVLGVAVVVAAMWFSGETYERAFYTLESRYPVTGLNEQAVVRYRGVDIGKVTDIRFNPQDQRVVLIDIAIQSDIALTRSAYAELRYQGVTGLSYVMLDDPRTSGEPLPPVSEGGSTRIPIRESLFSSLADAMPQLVADARDVLKRVNSLLSEDNQTQIVQALKNVEAATQDISKVVRALEPAARNSDALVADARKAFQQAETLMAEIGQTNRELAQRLDAIERAAGSAEKAGSAVAQLAGNAATETLPRINTLTDELARASRSLERLATQLKDQPQSLVFGRKGGPPGPGEPGFAAQGKR